MHAFHAMRALQPVGVLLGGSGHARTPALPMPIVPALLKPSSGPIGLPHGSAVRGL